MVEWFTETGFGYLLGVAMVPLIGLVLVYRGLWGDRNTRWRWGRTIIGVLLVLLSAYALVIVGGWWREQAVVRKYGIGVSIRRNGFGFFERIEYLAVIDPAQLSACRSLPHLHELWIWSDQVTDADLVHLKGLSKLMKLHLRATHVTDAGLVHLKGLSKLYFLNLSETQVTDAGLVHLQGMWKLWTLNVSGTQVTDEGVAKLKHALQYVEIER